MIFFGHLSRFFKNRSGYNRLATRNIPHVSWTFQVGDLVMVTQDYTGIPNDLPEGITMWEGNSPRVESGTIGLVVSILGDRQDQYPMLFLLIGAQVIGVCGKFLGIPQEYQ